MNRKVKMIAPLFLGAVLTGCADYSCNLEGRSAKWYNNYLGVLGPKYVFEDSNAKTKLTVTESMRSSLSTGKIVADKFCKTGNAKGHDISSIEYSLMR